jgi:two-component system KDP operon response regulator KdpE
MTAGAPAQPVTVLIVDDEPSMRRLLRISLAAQDYRTEEVATGREALAALRHGRGPDVVILDLGLPDIDGLEIIRLVRETSTLPIVVLSSRDDEKGKVAALDLGADDYLTKPFGLDELVARLRAALRHHLQQQGEKPIFRSADLGVDLVRRIVTVRGEEVRLSPKEYDLLRELVTHAGKVLTHRHLLHAVWGSDTDVQYLRIYIRHLRHKIEATPEQPRHILTEPGIGYRLKLQE